MVKDQNYFHPKQVYQCCVLPSKLFHLNVHEDAVVILKSVDRNSSIFLESDLPSIGYMQIPWIRFIQPFSDVSKTLKYTVISKYEHL